MQIKKSNKYKHNPIEITNVSRLVCNVYFIWENILF